jgi:hypothetical protein
MSTLGFDTITASDASLSVDQAVVHGAWSKSWIMINAAGNTIQDSYGISSITDTAVGNCTATHSSTMANSSYSVAGINSTGSAHSNGSSTWHLYAAMNPSTGSVQIVVSYAGQATAVTLNDYVKNVTSTGDLA